MAESPDPKKLQEIKKLLDDIAKGYDTLRQKNPFDKFDTKGIKDVDQTINQLQDALDGVNARVEDFTESVSESYDAFKSIVSEIGKVNSGLNESRKSYSVAASLAQKIRDHELGITNLSSKQLKQVKEKLESSKQNLKSATSLLQEERIRLRNGRELNELSADEREKYADLTGHIQDNIRNLAASAETYGKLNSQIDSAISKEKDLERQLGVTGGVLKGLAKIPILGDLFDTNEALEQMEDIIRKGGSSTEALGAGFKNMGSQIKGQLLNPANLVLGAITQLTSALKSTDQGAGEMAKAMNMTYSDALNTRRELGNIAVISGDAALTTKGLQETYMAIGQSLGSNAMASEATLKTFTKLREQAGYTNEQLTELNKLSLVNDKSLEDNTKEILGGAKAYASRKGLVINEKQVLNDVVKASASLKLSLGGSADKLAEAAVKTRAVGLNLEQASAMAESLLNFESSIENELSAELLTGKDLNLEKARTLALNGDIAGAAEEIANQVGSSADFANMNVIQQEALAKAAGLTKDQLAQSLMDREALAKLSAKEGESSQQAFNRLVKEVGMEEAKKRLGDEALAKQYEQQSVQEKFNQTVKKLQEIFVQVAEPILGIVSPLMNLVSTVLPAINILLQPVVGAFKIIGDIISTAITGAGKLFGIFTGTTKELGFWESTLGSLVIAFGAITAYSKASAAYAAFRAASENTTVRALAMQGLNMVKNLGLAIAEAVAKITGASAATLGIAAGIALAAGATAYAFLSSKKGNDIFSPGTGESGYGSRTLFGPEGAIQLNNKDTVIAGTNLFDNSSKADDMMSAPKGALQVSNSTTPKKETPVNPNVETNALLSQLLKGQKEVNAIPTLRIQ
jgi:hypothetical protein